MASSAVPEPIARTIVLVVDHDDQNQAIYAYALSASGFDVMLARNAREAHLRTSQRRPDLILANVAMNGEDNWALIEPLKQEPGTRDIPIVAVITSVSSPTLAYAKRAGCAALCLKSCPPDELTRGLRAVLDRGAAHNGV